MAGRAGHDVPLGRLLSAAPGIPTTDMARTIGHYRRLGFTFSAPGTDGPPPAGADFAIGSRDGVELHFARKPDHDPGRTATWVYVRVEDADELSAELDAAGAGQGGGARDTGYRMRELAHIDPDGNLLLFGSPARDDSGPPAAPRSGPQPGQGPPAVPDPGVLAFARALRQGDVPFLREALAADPGLATSLINSRTPLHLYADAPGHRPHPARVVAALAEAGADLDAHATGMRHHETPLHWAASNDDVELIDALLEAGADIEHPGSSISGGPPADSALGYAQWRALRRLQERGAAMNLPRAAALGLLPLLTDLLAAAPPPDGQERSAALWNACRAGQLDAARLLAGHGADIGWRAPWSGQTPLDAARDARQRAIVGWLTELGAPGE